MRTVLLPLNNQAHQNNDFVFLEDVTEVDAIPMYNLGIWSDVDLKDLTG